MRLPRIFRRRRPDYLCARFVEEVTDYLEGVMADEDRARLEEHLGECDGCDRYLEQILTTITLTGRLTVTDVETMAPTARDSLMTAFRDFHAGTQ
jgi:predicted anti-sigma-YlaC factor YlaD